MASAGTSMKRRRSAWLPGGRVSSTDSATAVTWAMRNSLSGDSPAPERVARGRSATITRTCPASATAARACADTAGACASTGTVANAIQQATSASTILPFILHPPVVPAQS